MRCTRQPIGIIGAMEIEVMEIIHSLESAKRHTRGAVEFFTGTLGSVEVVVAKCGIGKVAAALTCALMSEMFSPRLIINTGVAGALTDELGVLDVVLASRVLQHDFDLEAFGREVGFLPSIGAVYMDADRDSVLGIKKAFNELRTTAKLVIGTIASGDQFIVDEERKRAISKTFDAIACDMESAAIGQACTILNVPFVILRVISDTGDETEFDRFAKNAAKNSIELLKAYIQK